MLKLYEECRVFIVTGAVILNVILVLYFWLRSKAKNHYRDYYKGFLLLLLAHLFPQLFRMIGGTYKSLNYIIIAIWVLGFSTAGMIVIIRGSKRGKNKESESN